VGAGPYPPNTVTAIEMMTLDSSGDISVSSATVAFGAGFPVSATADGLGNLLVTGSTAGGNLQLSPGVFTNGAGFAAVVRISDSSVLYATRLPNGAAQSILPDGNGGFVTIGVETGNFPSRGTQITRFVPTAAAAPTVLGISNAAGLQVSPGLAPGEIVSIFGVNLGPAAGLAAVFDPVTGALPTNLGGTSVYFNGLPAPLLYAGSQQVNAIVPFAVPGGDTMSVLVLANSVQSNTASMLQNGADPEVFKSGDGGIFLAGPYPNSFAVNQDGTLNSSQNPAKAGSVITLFVSGAGLLTPSPVDGQRGGFGPQLFLPLTVTALFPQAGGGCCDRAAVQALYAGAAPTLAAGMLQLNLQLPGATAGLTSVGQEAGLVLDFGNQGALIPEDFLAYGAIWISSGN
jgi:uncharacterized protein (TIGR03437 family)